MTEDQPEIRCKKRVLEYAEKHGHIHTTCRRFGIAGLAQSGSPPGSAGEAFSV